MFSLLLLPFLVCPIHSLSVPSHHVIHEKRDSASTKWVKRGYPDSTAVLPMRIGLTQSSVEHAHGHLMDVSEPTSPNYGKHWTSEKVHQAFQPSNATIEAVTQWLEESGISSSRISQSPNKGWLNFGATVKEAEKLLYTQYHILEHTTRGHLTVACDEYHVPKHVREHVDFITPGIHAGHLRMFPDEGGKLSSFPKSATSDHHYRKLLECNQKAKGPEGQETPQSKSAKAH